MSNPPLPNTKQVELVIMETTGEEFVDEEGDKVKMTEPVGKLVVPVEVFRTMTLKELLKMWEAQQNR